MATGELPSAQFPNRTVEEVQEATIKAETPIQNNYLKIDFGYYRFIFPYDDGIAIMALFQKAEQVDREHYNFPKIKPITEKIESTIVSYDDYILWKMRTLLKLDPPE